MSALISVHAAGWAPREGSGTSPEPQVDFAIGEENPLLFITGPNGSGKTTLLRLISREIEPTTGSIHFSVAPLQNVGCLFQSDGLFPHLTVRQNLRAARGEGALDVGIGQLHVVELFGKKADKLSGGEERRVQFARLMILDRKIWILDEPTAGVDYDTASIFIEELDKAIRRKKIIVCVSHDKGWINALSERCADVTTAHFVALS